MINIIIQCENKNGDYRMIIVEPVYLNEIHEP